MVQNVRRKCVSAATVLASGMLAVLLLENVAAQNPCARKFVCSDCIRHPECSWCSVEGMDEAKRCFRSDQQIGCPPAYTFNPRGEDVVEEAEKLTLKDTSLPGGRSSRSSSEAIVQMSPQRVSLKLQINKPHRIKFAYSQAEDYPVDLYYLMDLSDSMEKHKDKLSELGRSLVESMQKVTSKFRLGFGSFVDKVVLPYASTVPEKLAKPCFSNDFCEAVYGYKHRMSLNNDTDAFINEVKNTPVSGNMDAPEGGLDALMQAIVCKEKIGWRERARHLVIYSSDNLFHYAGDGKLGGIVKRNDGKCHLDETGQYTHSSILDYPSVSHINSKVKEHSINIIFAIDEEHLEIYRRLKDLIEGSSVGLLSKDSSNIVALVEEEYEKISSLLVMQDNVSTPEIQLRYFTRGIEDKEDIFIESNSVVGLKVGSKVNFEVEFFAKECPVDQKDWKQVVRIYPVGLNESLLVDLELLCDCGCERVGHPDFKQKAEYCNKAGDLVCGICQCDDQHFGRQCECDVEGGGELEIAGRCRKDNSTRDCSGRGTCVCGVCICDGRSNPQENVWGPYCECDNFSCNYGSGEICSGPSHGDCVCGVCVCKSGWTGSACDCSTDKSSCQAPGSTQICSGRGKCKCGNCICDKLNDDSDMSYKGKHCERTPIKAARCAEYEDCVLCQMYQKGKYNEEECSGNCSNIIILPSSHIEANEEEYEVLCVNVDEDRCLFRFVYFFNGTDIVVRAQETLECPGEVNVQAMLFGLTAAIFFVGFAFLLLWKLCTTVKDRRECARFDKEVTNAKWDTGENPLYKQAITTFNNPMYSGNERSPFSEKFE